MADGGRRELEALGVGLVALGALVALALLSPLVGAGPGGNVVGPAGVALHRALTGAFGPTAVVAVAPVFAWSVYCFGAATASTALRWTGLSAAVLVAVPAGVWLAGDGAEGGAEATGVVGRTAGGLLEAGFGSLGGILILAALLLAVSVLTLGWSPSRVARESASLARAAAAGLAAAGRGAWRGARRLAESARSRWPPGGAETPWEAASRRREDDRASGREEDAAPAGREEAAPEPGAAPAGAEAQAELALADPGDLSQTELPPLDLLSLPEKSSRGLGDRELRDLADVLIEKLESFRVEGEIQGWTTGPVVTQFEVVPASGVKVGQIAARADDLALALKAPSVRIVAPIPGKGAVGVEVPNPEPEIVYLREVLESDPYEGFRGILPLALGRDLAGEPYCTDLARMPHLLIAGATGSGKSVCINTIITSLIYRYTPGELRLLMIDPKMVELSVYDDLPHLRHPVVTNNEEAASVLKWLRHEMSRRYELLSANNARSLPEFNRRVREGREIRVPGDEEAEYEEGELPFIVLLIDELADLMMTVQSEVEGPLAMLAQKARAVGIHLVIATQRPSVNVITGLIKANFPSRIAFRVASKTDSRTILDQNGAESLLGNGDMLFLPPGESDPVRIQGAYITGRDTERLVEWYRRQMSPEEAEETFEAEDDILEVVERLEEEEARVDVVEDVLEDRDDLFEQAAEVVVANDSGSTSLLQRRLQIGYGRAARIVDQLHHAGVVGPSRGSQAREVLVDMEELEELLGELEG